MRQWQQKLPEPSARGRAARRRPNCLHLNTATGHAAASETSPAHAMHRTGPEGKMSEVPVPRRSAMLGKAAAATPVARSEGRPRSGIPWERSAGGATRVTKTMGATTVRRTVGAATVRRTVGATTETRTVGATTVTRKVGATTVTRAVGATTVTRTVVGAHRRAPPTVAPQWEHGLVFEPCALTHTPYTMQAAASGKGLSSCAFVLAAYANAACVAYVRRKQAACFTTCLSIWYAIRWRCVMRTLAV